MSGMGVGVELLVDIDQVVWIGAVVVAAAAVISDLE